MRLYTAGKWGDKDRIRQIAKTMEGRGHVITHCWFDVEDGECSAEEMRMYADQDVKGVMTADAVLVVMDDPKYAYRGSFTEIGVALGSGTPVHLFNPHGADSAATTNVFYSASGITHYDNLGTMLDKFGPVRAETA